MIIADGNFNTPSLVPSDNSVNFNCCVEDIRPKNKFSFVYLRTKEKTYKAVYRENMCKSHISTLKIGDYINAEGVIKKQLRADDGYEINLTDFKVLTSARALPDFSTPDLSFEGLQKHRAFTIRNEKIRGIFRFQNLIQNAFIKFFENNGFENVNVPTLVLKSEMPSFSVDYFEKTPELPFSPMTYMSTATAAFEKTYTITHSFSSKRHTSSRHLNEFISMSFQAGYIENVYDIINILVSYIKFLIEFIEKDRTNILKVIDFKKPLISDIPVFTFNEALEILNKSYQSDLDPTDIKKICTYAKDSYSSDFVFVTDFPSKKRQFYAIDNKDNNTAQSFDLYFKGLKIATGSNNITDFDIQTNKMEKLNINTQDYEMYLQALKYGIMPYGGAMIGLERFTMQLLGLSNIREASLFMRDLHTFNP